MDGAIMGKLEELKKFVAEAFDAATDKAVIEKGAVINQKIEELEAEQKQKDDDYKSLLKDYKDVVLHPGISKDATGSKPTELHNLDSILDKALRDTVAKYNK